MKTKYKRYFVGLLLCLIILVVSPVVIGCGDNSNGNGSSNNGSVISALDTSELLANAGSVKTVEGVIVGTYYASSSEGQPTFLNFHDPYEGYFCAIIWGNDRYNFPTNPQTYYLHKKVRVTGLIETYEGAPEIILRNQSQISIVQ